MTTRISPRARNGQKVPTSRPMTIRMSTRPSSKAMAGWKVWPETPSANVPSLQWARKRILHETKPRSAVALHQSDPDRPVLLGPPSRPSIQFVPAVASATEAATKTATATSREMRLIARPLGGEIPHNNGTFVSERGVGAGRARRATASSADAPVADPRGRSAASLVALTPTSSTAACAARRRVPHVPRPDDPTRGNGHS